MFSSKKFCGVKGRFFKRAPCRRRLFYLLVFCLFLSSCKDIVFNNPLDPDASKDVLEVIRVMDTPLTGPGDIAFDGEKFWKINIYGNLTAFDRESGTVIRSFFGNGGTGVAFFLDSIYLCNGAGENILITLDPLSGDTLNKISMRNLYPGYITALNHRLIIYDVRSAGVFDYDPQSGDSVRLFEVSGMNIGGIAMYKSTLLLTDMNTDSLYRFKMDGTIVDVFSAPATGITGIGVDSSDFVFLMTSDGKVYKVSLP